MSITKRLIVWLVLSVTVLWLATALITRSVFVDEIDEMRLDAVRNTAHRLMPVILHSVAGPEQATASGGLLDEDLRFVVTGISGALAFVVRDQSGKTVMQSYDAKDVTFPDTIRPGLYKGNDALAYTLSDPASGLSLTVVEPNAHRREALAEATAALFLPMLMLVPVMGIMIWYLIRLATAPIRDLRQRISGQSMTERDPLEPATRAVELRPIARAVDQLVARLQATLLDERNFSADVAHELRTPVAGALAQAQRLRQEISGPATRRVDAIEAALHNLVDLTEKLLQVARFQAMPQIHKTREDLSPVIDLVLREVGAGGAAADRISVKNRLGQDLMVAMDPDIFAIALRNLIENALRHGDATAPVTIAIEKDWTVHVISGGPALGAEALDAVKTRFTRPGNNAEGHGLGLSIVDRLMKQSGGGLTLHSPATDRADGFEAVLLLP